MLPPHRIQLLLCYHDRDKNRNPRKDRPVVLHVKQERVTESLLLRIERAKNHSTDTDVYGRRNIQNSRRKLLVFFLEFFIIKQGNAPKC